MQDIEFNIHSLKENQLAVKETSEWSLCVRQLKQFKKRRSAWRNGEHQVIASQHSLANADWIWYLLSQKGRQGIKPQCLYIQEAFLPLKSVAISSTQLLKSSIHGSLLGLHCWSDHRWASSSATCSTKTSTPLTMWKSLLLRDFCRTPSFKVGTRSA